MSKRKARIKPVEDAMSYILSGRDKPGFAEKCINNIKGMSSSPLVAANYSGTF